MSGVESVTGALTDAAAWITEQTASLNGALGGLMEALGVADFLKLAARAIGFVAEEFGKLANWAKTQFVSIVGQVKALLTSVWNFARPILEIVGKLTFLALNPWLLPIVIAGWAWRILPECFKGPIINFVLDLMIAALTAIPDFSVFGDAWANVKQKMLDTLQEVRGMETERKIRSPTASPG